MASLLSKKVTWGGAKKRPIEAYDCTGSLPFEAGKHKRIAVKIVDDRGIERLNVIEVGV